MPVEVPFPDGPTGSRIVHVAVGGTMTIARTVSLDPEREPFEETSITLTRTSQFTFSIESGDLLLPQAEAIMRAFAANPPMGAEKASDV